MSMPSRRELLELIAAQQLRIAELEARFAPPSGHDHSFDVATGRCVCGLTFDQWHRNRGMVPPAGLLDSARRDAEQNPHHWQDPGDNPAG